MILSEILNSYLSADNKNSVHSQKNLERTFLRQGQGQVLALHPIHLYLIFEKSSWKNQVRRTGFLIYFELDCYFLCSLQKSISKLIFAGYTGSKNPVRID